MSIQLRQHRPLVGVRSSCEHCATARAKNAAGRGTAALDVRAAVASFDPRTIETDLTAQLIEWRQFFSRQIPIARQALSRLRAVAYMVTHSAASPILTMFMRSFP